MSLGAAICFIRKTAKSLSGEFSQLSLRGTRALLSAQTVGAVVLSVYLAELFAVSDRWWVALSAFAVIRGDFALSAKRCVERLAGTVVGAALAASISLLMPDSAWLFALILASVAGLGLYRTIGSLHSYTWILGTVTALMVLGEARLVPDIKALALLRVADVGIGVMSSLLVTALVVTVRSALQRIRPPVEDALRAPGWANAGLVSALKPESADGRTMRKLRALQSLQGAITIGGFALLAYRHHLPNFAQVLI